jgi:acetolactate synthase regulatory subunit
MSIPALAHPLLLLESGRSVAELLGASGKDGGIPNSAYERLVMPLHQVANGWIILDLVLGFTFAVSCAAALAWHPHHLRGTSTYERFRERRILLLIAIVGVVVAQIVAVEPSMALVVFGIGSLIRFRTVLATPEITVKGIMVVVIGLACGLSLFPLAVLLTGAAWVLLWFIDRKFGVRVRIDLRTAPASEDALERDLRDACRRRGYSVLEAETGRDGRRLDIEVLAPIDRTPETIAADLRAMLPPELQDAKLSAKVSIAF